MRQIPRIKVNLENNSAPPSAAQLFADAEVLGNKLHGLSFDTIPSDFKPDALHSLPPIVSAVQDVSTRLRSFNASATTGTHPSSAFHAARQIAYWSSVFVNMMSGPSVHTSQSTASVQPSLS